MDPALIVAISGAILGLLSWNTTRKRESQTTPAVAKDAASRAADAAVSALNAALDRQQSELEAQALELAKAAATNQQLAEDNRRLARTLLAVTAERDDLHERNQALRRRLAEEGTR